MSSNPPACQALAKAFLRKQCGDAIFSNVAQSGDIPAPDEVLMRRAIALARNGWGTTHPNPMVGAVVVAKDEIVGEGWHEMAGGPHAEINALKAAGDRAKGATIYVTLEPCSTFGRTPPCTDALIRAGVKRVVVGATDPNPQHAGRGFEILRNAGIEVTSGVLAEDCADLNPIFNHWICTKKTLFAGKMATTLDGRVATRTGQSKWITGPEAREDVHRWRRYYPAIAVGAGTVLSDNPSLTSRLPGQPEFCPRRFVFDRMLRTVSGAALLNLYTDAFRENTTVVTSESAPEAPELKLAAHGVGVMRLPMKTDAGWWDAFRAKCVAVGITGVFFEGGPHILSSLLLAGKLDYLYAYRAPVLLADGAAKTCFDGASPATINDGWKLDEVRHAVLGTDELLRGWIRRQVSQ